LSCDKGALNVAPERHARRHTDEHRTARSSPSGLL
jgi:hypothetical protein